MAIFSLIFIIALFSILESKSKNWISKPIFLLSLPTAFLIIIHKFIGGKLGQIEISDSAIYITSIGICCFGLGCIFYKFKRQLLACQCSKYRPTVLNQKIPKFLFFFSIIIIIYLLLHLKTLLANRTIMMLEDQEFANNGITAHFNNLLSISIIFFIGCLKIDSFKVKNLIAVGCLCACLFLKFLTAVKGELILPIIGGLIFLIFYRRLEINIKNICILVVIIIMLFVGMGIMFNSDEKEFATAGLIDFFSFYLFSGLTGLSGLLSKEIPIGDYPEWIIRTFVNFYEKFFGNGILDLESATRWVRVSIPQAIFKHDSNVGTLIGEIYLNCGWMFGSIVLFFLGWYSSFLHNKAKRWFIWGILYSYIGACLFLNFFSTYIIQPGFYEAQILCYILIIYYSKSKKDEFGNSTLK